jgi:hypothetical protein
MAGIPKPLFFVHVPKCAGTSLGAALEARFALTHADYDHQPHWRPWLAARAARQDAFCQRLGLDAFDCIHGHFPRRRYAFPDAHFATVLRHPLDRAISHFSYWKHDLPETNLLALAQDPIIGDIKAGRVGFVAFLRRCRIDGLCRSYLGEGDLSGFFDVSFTDEIGTPAFALAERLGLPGEAIGRARASSHKETPAPREIDLAREILAEEIAWFERVRAAWRPGV